VPVRVSDAACVINMKGGVVFETISPKMYSSAEGKRRSVAARCSVVCLSVHAIIPAASAKTRGYRLYLHPFTIHGRMQKKNEIQIRARS